METMFVCFHAKTEDVALFKTDNEYWIGIYSSRIQAQGVPPYYFHSGEWTDEVTAMNALAAMTGDEV